MVSQHVLALSVCIALELQNAAVMVVLILSMFHGNHSRKRQLLFCSLWSHAATVLCDVFLLVTAYMKGEQWRTLEFLGAHLVCIMSIITCLLLMNYVRIDVNDQLIGDDFSRKLVRILVGFNVTNTLLVISNPLTGWLFIQKGAGAFVPGSYLWVFFLLLVVQATAMPMVVFHLKPFTRPATFRRFLMGGMIVIVASVTSLVYGYITPLCIGVSLFFVLLTTGVQVRMEEELAQIRAEAAESRLRLLSGQIHPHFIFNSLAAIKGLVGEDPERAEQTIQDFSDYLRSHLDVMSDTRLVSFAHELEHVRHYVDLEKADLEDALEVRYELAVEDFRLPPLTVQPLVENAIRHGIRTRSEGGTVVISTYRSGEAVVVRVSDDGHGYSSATSRQDERRQVGIDNVRERIERQCGGTLEVKSGPSGTTATLTIPQEESL